MVLIYRYGVMNSGKTANLLMEAYSYKHSNKQVLLLKPDVDNRFGVENIQSRNGYSMKADRIITQHDDLFEILKDAHVDCVFIDECQFLTPEHVVQLRNLTCKVVCHGLKTDYLLELFPASKRLLELADDIHEFEGVCVTCTNKAIINAKFIKDDTGVKHVVRIGSHDIDVGAEEKYQAMCFTCWSA